MAEGPKNNKIDGVGFNPKNMQNIKRRNIGQADDEMNFDDGNSESTGAVGNLADDIKSKAAQVPGKIKAAPQKIQNAAANAKKVAKAGKVVVQGMIKVVSAIVKFIAATSPVSLIVIAIVIILIITIGAFQPDVEIEGMGIQRSNIDSQGELNNVEYERRRELEKQMDKVKDDLQDVLSEEDYNMLLNEATRINASSGGSGDELVARYDTTDGFQILYQDAIILLTLERLSYAWSFLEWEPDFDNYKRLQIELENLEKEKNNPDIKPAKLTEVESKIANAKSSIQRHEAQYKMYKELNSRLRDKYKEEKEDSLIMEEGKLDDDGNPVPGVISYLKDINGDETSEVLEHLSYFHNIITEKKKYEIEFRGENFNEAEGYLAYPQLSRCRLVSKVIIPESLQKVEGDFKIAYEKMHHEITLNLIIKDDILNSLFELDDVLARIKRTISVLIPIFEYVTPEEEIINKTLWDYEFYDAKYFNENSEYLFEGSIEEKFDELIQTYALNKDYNINFAIVENRKQKELTLKRLEEKLAYEEGLPSKNRDYVFIDEAKAEIEELKAELKKGPDSVELKKTYDENYQRVKDKIYSLYDEDRPYDGRNHSIFVGDDSFYLIYGEDKLDKYTERVANVEYQYNEPQGDYSGGRWVSGAPQDPPLPADAFPPGYKTKTTTNMQIDTYLASIKPTKVLTIEKSIDYEYNKMEVRDITIQDNIDRNHGPWTPYGNYWQAKVGETPSGEPIYGGPLSYVETTYDRTTTDQFINNGEMVCQPNVLDLGADGMLKPRNQKYTNFVNGNTNVDSEMKFGIDLTN